MIDVDPATPGFRSTMTVRAVSDRGEVIDTVTLARTAGAVTTPTPSPTPAS